MDVRRHGAPEDDVRIEAFDFLREGLYDRLIRKNDALLVITQFVLHVGGIETRFVERPVLVERTVTQSDFMTACA